jgi:hypothetical protein
MGLRIAKLTLLACIILAIAMPNEGHPDEGIAEYNLPADWDYYDIGENGIVSKVVADGETYYRLSNDKYINPRILCDCDTISEGLYVRDKDETMRVSLREMDGSWIITSPVFKSSMYLSKVEACEIVSYIKFGL